MMMRWMIAISGVAIGLILVLVFAFFFVTLELEQVPTEQNESSAAPPTVVAKGMSAEQAVYEPDWPAFETRWSEAPEAIRQLARVIAKGEIPEGLEQLTSEVLSRAYPAPDLDRERNGNRVPYLSTLLQEAVISNNLEGVRALLRSGADPAVNYSEAMFTAIESKTPTAPAFMLFPDFDASLPIVQALLDAGADPNMQRHGFLHVTPLNLADGLTNLGAMIALINAGADPWLRPPFADGTATTDSFMETQALAAGNHASAEVWFRVLGATKLPAGPKEQLDHVLARLDDVVEKFAIGTGPASRHTAWRLDQVLTLLGPAIDRMAETDRIRARLTKFDYQADGGWYLAADEIHSRYDAPLSVPDRGDQIWGP
ncbi:hypothetical protein SAMN04487972_106145 [Paracoccus halophilus]|uniref:Uncharacterized protein n=1 Tax=Paracoccus halophilus TaxID=376733 RepID=A0A099F576_9RHOB|nr:ankyrin repeat domain-containing protein [Paracoccus halophilus]KGJ05423.1 hypothetical protein IT41_06570 [Paracoccus halophilus]SFA49158.1 hypothetical protein SAMN04487972_106145 [Paracoccus halophilus]